MCLQAFNRMDNQIKNQILVKTYLAYKVSKNNCGSCSTRSWNNKVRQQRAMLSTCDQAIALVII